MATPGRERIEAKRATPLMGLQAAPADPALSIGASQYPLSAVTGFREVVAGFKKSRTAMVGVGILAFWILVALLGPLFVSDPTTPSAVDFSQKFHGPFSDGHILGTDDRGRDLLARMVYGARISILVGVAATLFSLILGVLLGAAAGYGRRFTDDVIMRIADIFFAFPYLLGTIAVVAILENSGMAERGFLPVIISLGVLSWAYFARQLRGYFFQLKDREYVLAARASGAGPLRIIRRHLLPNAMPLMIVLTALNVGEAVLAESTLSFLGAGIQEPDASWGLMLGQATNALGTNNWYMIPPGLALASLVFSFVVIGDGLRDAINPRRDGAVQ